MRRSYPINGGEDVTTTLVFAPILCWWGLVFHEERAPLAIWQLFFVPMIAVTMLALMLLMWAGSFDSKRIQYEVYDV